MKRKLIVLLALQLVIANAFGWGARGHRIVAQLALESLPPDAPAWLKTPATKVQLEFASSEPDRWRGADSDILQHEHKQDHYLDIELLDQFGLTLETIPRLRTEYLRAMIIAKHEHPEKIDPYDPKGDSDRTKEWPGQLLHGIAENYAKLKWSFCQVRLLERLNDPSRAGQLELSRAFALYHMGLLSHYVADAAQPLHTTRHFNGWNGPNPEGFTTSKKFHSYIDTGIIMKHAMSADTIRPLLPHDVKINAEDPWDDVLKYVRRSNAQVTALYAMEKRGELDGEPGKALIQERLADASAMLSALIEAAWTSSEPDAKQSKDFVSYDELTAQPSATNAGATPTTNPAGK